MREVWGNAQRDEGRKGGKIEALIMAAIRATSENSCLSFTKVLCPRSVFHYTFILFQGYVSVLFL
jgi:hypothetical protein